MASSSKYKGKGTDKGTKRKTFDTDDLVGFINDHPDGTPLDFANFLGHDMSALVSGPWST
jgi:hypothetical protein